MCSGVQELWPMVCPSLPKGEKKNKRRIELERRNEKRQKEEENRNEKR